MFENFENLLKEADESEKSFIDLLLEEESITSERSIKEIRAEGKHCLEVMLNSLLKGNTLHVDLPIADSVEQSQKMKSSPTFLSKDLKEAVYWAMSIMEYSNSMGIICAAPTAGSSGVFPAVLFKAQEILHATEESILDAYFVGATIGAIIGNNATISGSEGGCQAEIGVASAMAAAAITYLAKGTPEQIIESIALCLKNVMGLVCDPVAGLVISPCIKRNGLGVMNAFLASEMALSGVTSIIPADEVVEALKKVGDMMPTALKETSKGGIADTPTAKRIQKQIFED